MAALPAPTNQSAQHPRASRPAFVVGSRLSLGALLASWSCLTGTARAEEAAATAEPPTPSKAQCAASFEQSQRLRNSSSYVEASKEALICTNEACGGVLAAECGKLYEELQAATPSVVFGARDEQGNELTGVRVQIDAGETPLALDGKPVALDPGPHDFLFLADGSPPTHQTTVVRTGEQLRSVIGVLKKQPPLAKDAPPAANGPATQSKTPPLSSYVAGGVALAGFAGFVAFRISGAHDYDALAKSCKPNCTPDEVDGARRKYLFSNVGLAVGGAATIAAVTFYLAARPNRGNATALQVWHTGDGVAARLTTRF